MDASILYGLLTALLYGISDFVAKFSSREVGVWRTLFWGELCSATLLSLWLAFGGGAPAGAFHQPLAVWLLALAANLSILAGTALFYRALAIGQFAVVMPIVATYGAITALLSACMGEPLGVVAAGGIVVAVLGGAAASIPPGAGWKARARAAGPAREPGRVAAREAARAPVLAAIAALLYGVGFFAQAHYAVPRLGHLIPVWLYYGLGALLLGGAAIVLRRNLAPPRLAQAPVVLGTGLAASSAFVALTLAVAGGNIAVPTLLASLASVVTVVLARILIKERVAAHQWAGIAAVVFGLSMLHGLSWPHRL